MARSYMQVARKVSTLSLREWRELLGAQWELLAAQAVVRSRPIGALGVPAAQPGEANPAQLPEARRLALAVVRAARFGVFRPQCLVRSLALAKMLRSRGIDGAIMRIGVRRVDGEFLAHAWIEFAGETLGDADEHVGSFAPLTNLDVRTHG